MKNKAQARKHFILGAFNRLMELAPLRKIRDSYEKTVIAPEYDSSRTQDGIKIVRALVFSE